VSALDDKIDNLYSQPLGDFIGARNTLAKTLSGSDAQRVKALAKPTVVAWAANQVYFHARAAYNALIKSGERVRHAQIAALQGKAADIRAANDEHRRAVSAAVAEAERLAATTGSKPSADALTRTFEALSLTPHPPDPPGRLVEPLQPAGFEALAGITPVGGHRPPPGQSSVTSQKAPVARHTPDVGAHQTGPRAGGRRSQSDRDLQQAKRDREAERRAAEAEREAAAAARKREADLRKADAAVARAEATEKLARASWEHAHDALLEARRKRDEIRKTAG
jgi:hypothetical protein